MPIGSCCGSRLLTTLSLSKGGVGLLRFSLNNTLFDKEPTSTTGGLNAPKKTYFSIGLSYMLYRLA
jgi:hypothetical protein